MKHFNIIKKSLFAVMASAVFYSANAQTARFQLIHNAADPILDTVDIYIDGNKLDNVAFRQTTGIMTAASSSVKININDKNSADSSDLVLVRFSQNVAANSNTVMMVTGVANTASFAVNPNGLSTGVQLVTKTITNWAAAANRVQVNVFHGVTDAPGVDIVSRPALATGTLPTNLRFAQANGGAQALFFNNTATYLEARLTGTRSVIKAYSANLALFNQKLITVFASGFVTPTANQNGKAFGMFAVDTNGTVIELPEATRIQFIHNAPDAALGNVDIYFNQVKVVSNLAYKAATPFITANTGNTEVLVSSVGQNDTLFRIPAVNLVSGKSYLAMALGLKDTTSFESNPEGLNRMFNIIANDSMPEGSLVTGSFQYLVANGSTDAPQLNFNNVANQASLIGSLSYSSLSALKSTSSNVIFNISNNDKTKYNGAFLLNGATLLNQSGVIFTTGFFNTASFKVMLALNSGSVIELQRLKNKLQIIHNSPDTTIRMVDIYANGSKIVDDLGFRKTTGIASTDAYVPVRINIVNGSASDTVNSLWSASMLPDSNFNIAIAHGFVGAAYRVNPEAISTNFSVKLISPAKLTSSFPNPTNEVIFFHGGTNVGKLNMQGDQEPLFVAKNNSYGSVYKYMPTKGNAGAAYIVTDANTNTGLFTYSVNLVGKNGLAGVLFASGVNLNLAVNYKDTTINIGTIQNPINKTYVIARAANKADSILNALDKNLNIGFYIAWSNGKVDTFTRERGTNVKNVASNENGLVIFPNPANDKVSVMVNATNSNNAQINIIDIKGAIIKSIDNKLVSGVNVVELSVADLPKGMYFVQVTSNEGTSTKKLVIE
ncbi:MAG: DUF4397 domain-containing protein [Bacteroidia bacterium]